MYLNDASSIPVCSKWRRNSNQELDLINRWEYLAYPSPRGVSCNEGYLDCCIVSMFHDTHGLCFTARGGVRGVTWDEVRSGTGVSPVSIQVCSVSVTRHRAPGDRPLLMCTELPGIAICACSALACLRHIPLSHSQSNAGRKNWEGA